MHVESLPCLCTTPVVWDPEDANNLPEGAVRHGLLHRKEPRGHWGAQTKAVYQQKKSRKVLKSLEILTLVKGNCQFSRLGEVLGHGRTADGVDRPSSTK